MTTRMKQPNCLRIASVLTFIHAAMHTVGGVFGKPQPGVATSVAAAMQANRFPVFGVTRSYADFYLGLGLAVTISLIVTAVLLWQLASLAEEDAAPLRPVLITLALSFLAFAVNSYLYFFWGPVVIELLIAACLSWAIAGAHSPTPSAQDLGRSHPQG